MERSETTTASPSTVLVCGDWHGNVQWMERVLRRAAKAGIGHVVHVGDLAVLWPAPNDRDKFTKVLRRRLEEHGVSLVFVDGNHDVHPRLRALPRDDQGFGVISERLLYAPRGHRWSLGGVRFGALGGAYSVDRRWRKLGRSWWEGEEVEEHDVARLGDGPLDVLITHEVPASIGVEPGGELPEHIARDAYTSRLLVRDAVRRTGPRLVFSGHWHQRLTETVPYTDTVVHVLHRDLFEGNAVTLDLATLTVEEFPLR